MSVNKQILKGHLGSDVKSHTFQDGKKVAQFTLATNSSYKHPETGERVTTTEWHNCRVRDGLVATFEKYVKKGHEIYIEGPTKTRQYTDKDGVTRYVKEVYVDTFDFCNNGSKPANAAAPPLDGNSKPQDDNDDLPF